MILYFLFGFSLVLAFNPNSLVQAAAPITPSGLNTQVNLSATPPAGKTQFDITGGDRPGVFVPPTMLVPSSQAGPFRGQVAGPRDCCAD